MAEKELHTETYRHHIDGIGFADDKSVVITFDNGPFNGEVILSADTFEKLYKQWKAFKGA